MAANQQEAEMLAAEYGRPTREEADEHLKECRKPPTDPLYGNQLHVYKVVVKV